PRRGITRAATIAWPSQRSGTRAFGAPFGFGFGRTAACFNRLDRLALRVRRFLVFGHAFLEGLDALSKVTHQRRNLSATSEQDHHAQQNDDPVPYTWEPHQQTPRSDGFFPARPAMISRRS